MHAPLYGYQNSIVAEQTFVTSETIPIRTSFVTPEGVYRQMTVNEFFRANRIQNQVAGSACNTPVRFSFLRIPATRLSFAEEALPSTSDVHHQNFLLENYKDHSNEMNFYIDRICHNIGREIYVFDYTSLINPSKPAKQVDKRVYKGTFPTCHDFKQVEGTLHSCELLIGFSAGQIQLVDPSQKEVGLGASSKLFNEDRLVDKSAVTCLKWVPGANQLFAASHASGNLYFYNEELSSPQMSVNYQILKQGSDYSIYGCKAKAERNPIYRWTVGQGAVNKFEFAGPHSSLMATVSQYSFDFTINIRAVGVPVKNNIRSFKSNFLCSFINTCERMHTGIKDKCLICEDGVLRVFDWKSMELVGFFKSYFGGLLCLSWSPDYQYIATGGEDDLLTLYSVNENRVICRGQAHKSWISEVAFDCFVPEFTLSRHQNMSENGGDAVCSSFADLAGISSQNGHHLSSVQNEHISSTSFQFKTNHSPGQNFNGQLTNSLKSCPNANENATNDEQCVTQPQLLYRIGTVGHDCQLCLWDISEDTLASLPAALHQYDELTVSPSPSNFVHVSPRSTTVISVGIGKTISNRMETETVGKSADGINKGSGGRFKKFHKRGFSFGSRSAGNERKQQGASTDGANSSENTLKKSERIASCFFGTAQCPRLEDVPMIEPLMCKKIAHERLGTLLFREDCIVTACQEGIICTWARPNLFIKQDVGHHDEPMGKDHNCNALSHENCDGTSV